MIDPIPSHAPASEAATGEDPWLEAFLRRDADDVFHAVVHTPDIHLPDPFDVATIHTRAREAFGHLVTRARNATRSTSGRSLLILGEAGAGKTHLMRAFRNNLHQRQDGYVAYLQMTSALDDYARYVLGHVIDALARPYDVDSGERTALQRLSDHLIDRPRIVPPKTLRAIREEENTERLRRLVNKVVNALVRAEPLLEGIDSEVLPALIYLQSEDPSIRRHITPLLRCKDLSPSAREDLGGLPPMLAPDDPLRVLEHLGSLMRMCNQGAFVILVDQLETNAADLGVAENRFRRAMQTLSDLVDRIPNVIVVVSCLRDFWMQFEPRLARSILDRLLKDPEPVALVAQRNGNEAVDLVAARMEQLFATDGLAPKPANPVYPFLKKELEEELGGKTGREIIERCRQAREVAIAQGARPSLSSTQEFRAQPAEEQEALEVLWSDFLPNFSGDPPGSEAELALLLGEALESAAPLATSTPPGRAAASENRVAVHYHSRSDQAVDFQIAICDAKVRGRGLVKQLGAIEDLAPEKAVALVRTGGFKYGARTQIAAKVGELVKKGWLRVPIEEAEWRSLAAFLAFRDQHSGHPDWRRWTKDESPLATGAALSKLFDRRWIEANQSEVVPQPPPPAPDPAPERATGPSPTAPPPTPSPKAETSTAAPLPERSLSLGQKLGVRGDAAILRIDDLTRHGAIVGGSGSGKTTLAMHLIESLLLQSVPVLVVDRKGDLASWARSDAFSPKGESEDRERRRKRLNETVQTRLFTPGDSRGCDIGLPVLPRLDLDASAAELDESSQAASSALAAMLGYKVQGTSAAKRAVLRQAVQLLSDVKRGEPITLAELIDFVASQDASLLAAIGHLDEKTMKNTARDLQTLLLNNQRLLGSGAPELSGAQLLGMEGIPADRTALTIISAIGLGSQEGLIFWVSRLFATLSAYATKNPSDKLQAIVLLDEADLYLPARSSPATKAEIGNALRRWRSAGLGVLLSSQSPADFDYQCRDNIGSWFVGLVKESRAHEKLRPLFESTPLTPAARLPRLGLGQFLRLDGSSVVEFQGERSLTPSTQVPEAEIRQIAHDSP